MKTEFILVECISTYRIRYVVEVPKGKISWANECVFMDEAKEFSQKYLDELHVSSRPISKDEALSLYREDNPYVKSWSDDKIVEVAFTTMSN